MRAGCLRSSCSRFARCKSCWCFHNETLGAACAGHFRLLWRHGLHVGWLLMLAGVHFFALAVVNGVFSPGRSGRGRGPRQRGVCWSIRWPWNDAGQLAACELGLPVQTLRVRPAPTPTSWCVIEPKGRLAVTSLHPMTPPASLADPSTEAATWHPRPRAVGGFFGEVESGACVPVFTPRQAAGHERVLHVLPAGG